LIGEGFVLKTPHDVVRWKHSICFVLVFVPVLGVVETETVTMILTDDE
jgi:hypothetical protein